MGFIYLLHFHTPYKHAKHYLGYSEKNYEKRIEHHRRGTSKAKLMTAVKKAGISFDVALIIPNVDRAEEKRLKLRGKGRLCPICIQNKLVGELIKDLLKEC